MSIQDIRGTAERYVLSIPMGRIEDDLLTQDFSAWSALSGELSGEALRASLTKIPQVFPDGLQFAIVRIVADDSTAAVQARSHGTLHNGDVYRNEYMFLFEFSGGRIRKAYEYFNTQTVLQVLAPAMRQAETG